MKLKALAVTATVVLMPFAASASSTNVQSEVSTAPLSAGVLLVGTALVAIAALVMRRKV